MTSTKRNPAALAHASRANAEVLSGTIDKTDNSAVKPTRQERWRARNPLATWAHSAARSAFRRGLLERKPCAICGDPETDFHHDPHAYDQPLRGTFLCRRHHKAEHKRLKGGAK